MLHVTVLTLVIQSSLVFSLSRLGNLQQFVTFFQAGFTGTMLQSDTMQSTAMCVFFQSPLLAGKSRQGASVRKIQILH